MLSSYGMTGPLTHLTLKYLVSALAFTMALLLTPRALVDSADADDVEISVQLLERPEDCLWCSPPPASEPCDDDSVGTRHWLNPDETHPGDFGTPCDDRDTPQRPGA